eukprot:m.90059 g.90059  ORF g.90059 m.90059 type:complete len:320 (+) comp8440_c0_seq3:161-1120(+)
MWEAQAGMAYMGRRLLRENELVMIPEGFFPRVQTKIHAMLVGRALPKNWRGGIMLVVIDKARPVEIMITLTMAGSAIDIWARTEESADCLPLLRNALDEAVRVIQDIRAESCPNVDLALMALSPRHLRSHAPLPYGFLLDKTAPTDPQALWYPTHPRDATHVERVLDILGPPQAAPDLDPHPPQAVPRTTGLVCPLPPGFKYHVFLSHDWGLDQHGRDNHATLRRINAGLKRRGLVTWFDEERMRGFIPRAMAEGIEQAKVVVCFLTQRYQEKATGDDNRDNVQLEFNHAFQKKTPKFMTAVPMETRCLDTRQSSGVPA